MFAWKDARLAASGQIAIARPMVQLPPGTTDLAGTGFIGGLAIDGTGRTLYAVHVLGRAAPLLWAPPASPRRSSRRSTRRAIRATTPATSLRVSRRMG